MSGDTEVKVPAGLVSQTSSGENQASVVVLPRQKSRSRERRESRMYLVDGQLCWLDDLGFSSSAGGAGGARHSSVGLNILGSSMDLSGIGQSMDSSGGSGGRSEEAISYRIKWCRESIAQLKRQCWPMEKKLQVLKASKLFIKQHQGDLKQSKQAKDVITSTSVFMERSWRHFKREFANFLVIITPWEMRIKKIESHFGSVVASYFTFLRWIFWLNLANSLVMVIFVMVPELIENVPDMTGMRKGDLGMQQLDLSAYSNLHSSSNNNNSNSNSSDQQVPKRPPEFNPTLGEMWEFEGVLKFSPIFYGYYSNVEISKSGFWRNPLAFLLSAMLTYLFCFFCISRKLSQNTKLSRIGSKDDEYTFCWTVFVGWDFMIGNNETAYNKTSSLVMNLKEGILEEKEQTKDRNWRLIMRRIFANVLTIMLIVASAYVVTLAVQRSENLPEDASLLQKNELQLVMSGIQFMFPPLFDVVGIIEKYHPRKALSWQLGRILFLDFLNFYTLMFSLFGTVAQMSNQLNEVSGNITQFRRNATYINLLFAASTTPTSSSTSDSDSSSSSSASTNTTTTATTSASSTANSTAADAIAMISQPTDDSNATTNSSYLRESATTQSTTTMIDNSSSVLLNLNGDLSTAAATATSASAAGEPTDSTTLAALGQMSTTPSSPTGEQQQQQSPPATSSPALTAGQPSSTPPTTRTTMKTAVTSTATSSGGKAEDEDYPDVGEVVKSQTARVRRQVGSSRAEAASSPQPSKSPSGGKANPPRVYPLIPPMRDPYFPNGWSGVRGVKQPAEYADDSPATTGEEEPIEGRLVLRTHTRKPAGVARPIGGNLARPSAVATGRGRQSSPSARGSLGGDLDATADDNNNKDDDDDDDGEDNNKNPKTTEKIQTATQVAGERALGGSVTSSPALPSSPSVAGDGGKAADSLPPSDGQPTQAPPATTASDSTSSSSSSSSSMSSMSSVSSVSSVSTTSGADLAVQSKSALGDSEGSNSSQAPPGVAVESAEDDDLNDLFATTTGSTLTARGCDANLTASSSVMTAMTTTTTADANSSSSPASRLLRQNASAVELSHSDCAGTVEFKYQEIVALNDTLKDKLKSLCWETMFGQEMVKIVVMDLVMTVISAISFEFMRACFVRYCNRFFFWDLERGFPGYQDFKIAENVLHLVNNQSTVWMGMFFAPGLPAINTLKLAVLMYVRSWAVLTCNIPHETVFKVSKSNNFYYWILLINLLICILPVAYAVTWIRPSWHCGPFGGECRMYLVITKLAKATLPPEAEAVFRYLTSPGAIIPILISLILTIYYLASTVSSSKEANKELKAQLKKDKEQEAAVPEITTNASTTAVGEQSTTAVGSPAAADPNLLLATNNNINVNSNSLAPSTSSSYALQPPRAEEPKSLKSLLMPPKVQ